MNRRTLARGFQARGEAMLRSMERVGRLPDTAEGLQLETCGALGALLNSVQDHEERFETLGQAAKPGPTRVFSSFGEQLQAIAKGPGSLDRRIVELAAGQNEDSGSDGGLLVQPDFAADLLLRTYEAGVLARQAQRIPIKSKSDSITLQSFDETSRANASRYGGIQAFWAHEADAITASQAKFRQMELRPHKLTGLCYVTNELLADANALQATIARAFEGEFSFKLDFSMVFGSGVGEPLGGMNAPCLITVAKEAAQASATIVPQNVIKMWSRMWGPSRKNAVWLTNQDTDPQLYTMSLNSATPDAPIFTPAGESDSPYCLLFGRPVIPVEFCQTLGTTGDLILCDPTRYLLADKGPAETIPSIHVKFSSNEMAFKFVLRIDGQPEDSAPLTPFRGANTLSTFVALATR